MNKKKRVLIFSQAGVFGGAESYVVNLVRYLVSENCDVVVCLCFHQIPKYMDSIKDAGGTVISTNKQLAYQRGLFTKSAYMALREVNAIIRNCSPDVVILNRCATWFEFRHVVLALIFKPAIRLVAVEHHHPEGWPEYPARKRFPRNLHVKHEVDKVLCLVLSRFHDVFISMNKIAKETFIHEYKYPENKVYCIYNGIEIDGFSFSTEKRRACREKINKNENDFVVVSVARHSYEKGIDVLIRAVEVLTETERNKFTLVLVGGGPLHDDLKKLSKELKIDENIIFVGEQADVSPWISAADVFIAPSRKESFGLSIAEAMAANRCVIASRVGGIPELVGDAAILVEPDNSNALSMAIQRVMHDDEFRKKLGKQAEHRIEQYFTIEHSMEKTFNLIIGD